MKKVLAWICAAAMWVTVFCVPAGAAEKTELEAGVFTATLSGTTAVIQNRDGATLILENALKVTEEEGTIKVYTLPDPGYQVKANSFAVFLSDSGAFNSAPASRYRIFEWNADGTRGKPTGEILTTAELLKRGIVAECNPTTEDKHWEILPDNSKGTLKGLRGPYSVQLSNKSILASDNNELKDWFLIEAAEGKNDSKVADVVKSIPVEKNTRWVYLSNGKWQYWSSYDGYETPAYGWKKVGGKWYYFYSYPNSDEEKSTEYFPGDMVTGWVGESPYIDRDHGLTGNIGGQYYLQSDGSLKTGWVKRDKDWYYLDPQTLWYRSGWFQDTDGKWYYLSPKTGKMHTDWVWDSGNWYYCGQGGSICRDGWYPVYPASSGGVAQVGDWNGFRYFRADGTMATGWVMLNHAWHYFKEDGGPYHGWLLWKNEWYYIKQGRMLTNTSVDGFYLGKNGAWIQ